MNHGTVGVQLECNRLAVLFVTSRPFEVCLYSVGSVDKCQTVGLRRQPLQRASASHLPQRDDQGVIGVDIVTEYHAIAGLRRQYGGIWITLLSAGGC